MNLLIICLFLGYFARGQRGNGERLQYSHDFLVQFRASDYGVLDQIRDWPAEILRSEFSSVRTEKTTGQKVRKRGKKGGLRQRLRKQRLNRIPLPSIILANCQSLRNKLDELQANVRFLSDYRNACVISLTETWLKEHDSDSDLEIDGFGGPVRLDREAAVMGKSLGGGVCIYVNQRWCRSVILRESVCTPDIELLSISLRPFYLPREFPQMFISVVYIHPKANVDNASDILCKVVHRLQIISSEAPNIVMGDFNHCKMKTSLTHFEQCGLSYQIWKMFGSLLWVY